MSWKRVLVSSGYSVASIIIFPLFAIGISLALFVYAIFGVLRDSLIGSGHIALDSSGARAAARRVCLGIKDDLPPANASKRGIEAPIASNWRHSFPPRDH